MRDTMYSDSVFDKCDFLDCNLKRVDFEGSRFFNCRFTGDVKEVFFRKYGRITPRRKPNEMLNIDFSEAKLESVSFVDDIDLTGCKFPLSEDYIHIRQNRKKIFEEIRKTVETAWEGMDKKIAMALLDNYFLLPSKEKQQIEFIDRFYLESVNEKLGRSFFELIKRTDSQMNQVH
jgi:hypothetical protein